MNLKHFATSVALLIVCQQTLTAQNTYTGAVSFGTTYSTLHTDLFTVQNARVGFSAGLAFAFPINDRIEINPEFAYVQKGGSARASFLYPEQSISNRTYNFNYNAFETNVLVGVKPLENFPIRLHAGAYLAAMANNLSDKSTDLYIGNLDDYNTTMPIEKLNNAFAGLDFGPVAGISIGNGRFRANLRYQAGLPNLYNKLEFMPAGHSIHTSAARLTMTYFMF
jgi:hypothetical protein